MAQNNDLSLSSMVCKQITQRGIKDRKVIDAMLKVKRHLFVPSEHQNRAYADHPLSIGFNQTISQPYMVGIMTEALKMTEGMSVLEIGTGSGYQTAVLSEIAETVYTIERIPELYVKAASTLKYLGYDNVITHLGDGSLGWFEYAPYDRIIVTAGSSQIPPPLIKQLNMNGILVIPVGDNTTQTLYQITKVPNGNNQKYKLKTRSISYCIFVPLIGEYA